MNTGLEIHNSVQRLPSITECGHAYRVPIGTGLFRCVQCGSTFNTEKEEKQCTTLVMPPEIFGLSEKLWTKVSPWPLLPYEIAKRYGWYITIIGLDEYLVMPIIRNGQPVFYSARRLTNNGGLKYYYQTGCKRHYWISRDKMESPIVICEGVADSVYTSLVADSVALLSNYYNGSLDSDLAGKRVIVALDGDSIGFTSAVRIAKQLQGICNVTVASLPEGKDPTDLPIAELKELLRVSV